MTIGALPTTLALGSDGWSQLIVALSIFGPLVLTAALVVWVIRGGRSDPDELRHRRLQAEHRAQHADEEQ